MLPVRSNPEFDERRTKNVGTIEMRNNAFLNCSSFVVLSSSFVLTYSPERAVFTVPFCGFASVNPHEEQLSVIIA